MADIRFLPAENEYTHAIMLLLAHCQKHNFFIMRDPKVKEYVIQEYFPSIPKINFNPMEPRSTNGLERHSGSVNLNQNNFWIH